MRALTEEQKKSIISNYFEREKEIDRINKQEKKCIIKSVVIISAITISLSLLIGPVGLLALGLSGFSFVELDYLDRCSRDVYDSFLKGKMTRREFKKSIKNGELKRYYDEMKRVVENEKSFSEIFKMETPKSYEKYTSTGEEFAYKNERQK